MSTFAPSPDDDLLDNYRDNFPAYVMVSALRRAMGNLLAQSFPEPNPALQMQRAMGQVLAQQINQRTTLQASLAVNRLATTQRLATANASARLPKIVSSSFSLLVRVQARVARDSLLGDQWRRTMLSLYPSLRAREALENIPQLTRGLGNFYYLPRRGFGSYQPRTIPKDPESSDTATDIEIMDELPDMADSDIAIRDVLRGLRRWARENPTEAQIVVTVTVCVVGIASNVLIAIYL